MADEVTQTLEKMKLTVEEAETITISNKGRKEEIESCELSLIGKFLTCKSFNKKAALLTLKKAWGLEDGVQVVEVGTNLFQFVEGHLWKAQWKEKPNDEGHSKLTMNS